MGFKIIPTDKFKKEAKRLIRKYPSVKTELRELENILLNSPDHGKPLGNNTFKVRIGIKSKGKGKSGGGRVITYLVTENQEVYLMLIYDKSEFESVNNKIIAQLIERIIMDKKDLP
jgi:mRNA-degrading endonuclease RelE of RelBE toxin-antitoxin system